MCDLQLQEILRLCEQLSAVDCYGAASFNLFPLAIHLYRGRNVVRHTFF